MSDIPAGYCQCGCGGKTSIAKLTSKRDGHIKGKPVRFISGHNSRGETNPNWQGGISQKPPSKRIWRREHGDYYVLIKSPNHPRAMKSGFVYEHVLLAEKALGKPLPPKAVVHHHTPDQLVICQDTAYHRLLHDRQRAIKECGHANWRKCCRCKKWDSPDKLIINKGQAYHQGCNTIHQRKIREQRNGNQI